MQAGRVKVDSVVNQLLGNDCMAKQVVVDNDHCVSTEPATKKWRLAGSITTKYKPMNVGLKEYSPVVKLSYE